MKILLIANTSSELLSRKKLLRALLEIGYKLYIVSNMAEKDIKIINELNITSISIPIFPRSKNILKNLSLYVAYKEIFRSVRPDIILSFHIKPNIYGGLLAKKLNIPFIVNITGLGSVFEKASFTQKLVVWLYKKAFNSKKCFVFFQNKDDKALFIDKEIIIYPEQVDVLPGSGVDLDFFSSKGVEKKEKNIMEFSYIGRLVIAKGVKLFIDAAQKISESRKDCIFNIAGSYIEGDKEFLQKKDLELACKNPQIKYHGKIDDVRSFLMDHTDCLVFPSYYREGVPRCLLEGAAMVCPLIASNSVGTKEPCKDGINGYLFEERNLEDLVQTILKFLDLGIEKRREMGLASRRIAEKYFSDEIVLDKYLKKIKDIVNVGNS